jgi:hypothetical protein
MAEELGEPDGDLPAAAEWGLPFSRFLREECGDGFQGADELDRLVAALERDAARWKGALPQLASDLLMVTGRTGLEAESLRAAA